MNTISKYKIGSSYPNVLKFYSCLFSLIGYPIVAYSYNIIILLGLFLIFINVYVVFVKVEFWVDIRNKKIKLIKNLLGLKIGTWDRMENYRAISIRVGKLGYIKSFSEAFTSEDDASYEKLKIYSISLLNKNNKTKFIAETGSKSFAFVIIKSILNTSDDITPYVTRFNPKFELNKEAIFLDRLVLVNQPERK